MSATDLALRHGRALLFLSLAAALAGLVSARALPKAVYPEVAFPREQIVATLAGASADAVTIALTRPLESGLAGVPGVEQIRSKTIRGAVELSLFFSPDTDMAASHALLLARKRDLRIDRLGQRARRDEAGERRRKREKEESAPMPEREIGRAHRSGASAELVDAPSIFVGVPSVLFGVPTISSRAGPVRTRVPSGSA